MTDKKLRIGVVGLGIGRHQLNCFLDDDRVKVTAIAENAIKLRDDGENVEKFVAGMGAKLYRDGVEMINSGDIDAVSLAVTPKHRMVLLEAAAKRKMPVLMEKPMSANLAEAVKMARIIRDSGMFFMMEYPMRYFPQMVELRELIDNGTVGQVLSLNAELQTPWNPPETHWAWDPENGNGLLNEAIIHLYDTANYLCGTPVSVYAVGGHYFGKTNLEDSAILTVRYQDGAVATLNGGGLGTTAMAAEPLSVHVFGRGGEAIVTGRDWLYTTLKYASRTDKEPTTKTVEPPARFKLMGFNTREFARCVIENAPTACGLEAGLLAQCVVDAMKESIRTGQVAKVKTLKELLPPGPTRFVQTKITADARA
jgi:predicted dehydrogenase